MKLGGNDISTVKLGASQVQAIYSGTDLVWQNAPVATAATGVGQTSFTANWNAYTGAVYYLLDVSESSSFSTFVYENQITTSTSYVVIGLDPNTTYYYRVRASTSYDTDAQAFFDRVDTAGGTLSTTEQDAVSTLVVQMKDAGIWTKMKAIYPMVGASAAACAQNLKSSSFTGSFTSGWTFASTGVTPNGTSAYMDTGFLPSTSFTNNDTHISFYSRTNANSSGCNIGTSKNASAIPLITIYARNNNQYFFDAYDYNDNRILINNTISSAAFFLNTRTSSTSFKAFRNASQFGSTNTVANTDDITTCDEEIYLGCLNINGTAGQYSDYQCAFASIGDGLTDTEASDFYDAVQAFQTTLSRNV